MSATVRRHARTSTRRAAALLLSVGLLGSLAGPASARPAAPPVPEPVAAPTAWNPSRISLRLRREVSGLSQPVYYTSAHDNSGRLFIVEKGGRIKVHKNGRVNSAPFLDLSANVSDGPEQGLLGLAFHPGFRTNGKFYVNLTLTNGDTAINEYRVGSNPDQADWRTGRRILTIDQPYANHNGGHMAFGRDGYLYIATGDGGSRGDPGNRAQSLTTLLGKILRIDINGTTPSNGKQFRVPSSNPFVGRAGWDEIWSYGLRNPWRFSFDRATGYMWVADVGQGRYEEVNRALNASGPGRAVNYGWRQMEGRHCYNPSSGCDTRGKHWPIAEYPQSVSGTDNCSVTGGYVYRGRAFTDLQGGYIFGDYCSGRIWGFSASASSPTNETLLLDTGLSISSFGENQSGDLFVTDLAGGAVYRLIDG